MELLALVAMIAMGGAIAIAAAVIIGWREGASERAVLEGGSERQQIAASVLYAVARAGGASSAEALRQSRAVSGVASPVSAEIDIPIWGERYAQLASQDDRRWLLETAVRMVASRAHPVPLRQYVTLLDLSFALGFQTDALARLRERYPFEYYDHARDARPRTADRAGGAMQLFRRDPRDAAELLKVLGIDGEPSRHAVITAYRRFVAQNHPDRFHGAPEEEQSAAAARFIETTRAYEALLAIYRV